MRRVGLILVVLVLVGGAGFGAYRYGYQQGNTAGKSEAANDRSAFFATRGSAPGGTSVAGGSGMVQGASGVGGNPGSQGGAGGQRAGGGGAPGTGASPAAGGRGGVGTPITGGSPAAGRAGTQNGVAGRVTQVNGQAFIVQSTADSTNVNVVTSGMTVFTKVVDGSAGDLKVNDFVAVQGDKTGDNAYTARTITGTNAQALAGAAVSGFPGASGGPLAGTPAAAGGTGGRGPSGNAGQVVGRITQMDGGIVTLATLDGTMIAVTTTPMTKVQTTQSAALSDITMGDMLVVVGERMGDSVTARLVTDQGQS